MEPLARTPCTVLVVGDDGVMDVRCRLSVEEHHRLGLGHHRETGLSLGYYQETVVLKARLRHPEALDTSTIPTAALLAELARRLENRP